MNDLQSSKNQYHQALVDAQLALEHYFTSISGLFKFLQQIDDTQVQSECHRHLSIAMNQVIDIQHLTKQKENLLGFEPQPPLSVLHHTNSPTFSHQPNIARNLNLNPTINTNLNGDHHLIDKPKYERPVKPWLSEKVYRSAYITKKLL